MRISNFRAPDVARPEIVRTGQVSVCTQRPETREIRGPAAFPAKKPDRYWSAPQASNGSPLGRKIELCQKI